MSTSIRQACLGVIPCLFATTLLGCAGGEAASPTPGIEAITSGSQATETPNLAEYRHRNHGGASRLIAVALQELELTSDQRVVLEKLREDLLAKREPGRAAGRELAKLLADEVATGGAVDRAKVDVAIAKVGEAGASLHQATIEDLNRLHEALTPQQRTALIAKMQSLWSMWAEAQREAAQSGESPPRDVTVLAQKLGLSQEQSERILARFTASMQGVLLDYYPRDVGARTQEFSSSFRDDAFDAGSLHTQPGPVAPPPTTFGATRMARFFEAFAPELTPDQRAKLALDVREHANRHDQP
jgi:Spy/CpxP family protein refolding chaperone